MCLRKIGQMESATAALRLGKDFLHVIVTCIILAEIVGLSDVINNPMMMMTMMMTMMIMIIMMVHDHDDYDADPGSR